MEKDKTTNEENIEQDDELTDEIKEEIDSYEESKSLVEKEDKRTSLNTQREENPLVSNEQIKNYYAEAIECIRQDREEADERYLQFADMVINDGDPSTATKETMVNLLKVKTDGVNQMVKILDLWTRLAMKDKVTSSQVYAFQQNNKYENKSNPSSRIKELIKIAEQTQNQDKDNNE